jgi:hypothetical protein
VIVRSRPLSSLAFVATVAATTLVSLSALANVSGLIYAFAAALGGCSLTTSFDGLSGGSPSNPLDGGDDAVAKDATTTTDGPTDAGLDAEADAPDPDSRCTMITPAPAFCSDFDTGTIDAILGTPNTALGGSVAFDETTRLARTITEAVHACAHPWIGHRTRGRREVVRTRRAVEHHRAVRHAHR